MNRVVVKSAAVLALYGLLLAWVAFASVADAKGFRAGAAAVDITPRELPVLVSGGFLSREANAVTFPLFARSLVLDDGRVRLAIVVVDTLAMPRELIDQAKQLAARATGIPVERMLIAATHTHTAPSVIGALGTSPDPRYTPRLAGWIAQSIEQAAKAPAPAEAGWLTVDAPAHTHCRRWILRPDRVRYDPFGFPTVRAQMHPGYQNPDFLGPAGPVDPGLTLLAIRARSGRPMALYANYSMHYVGDAPVGPDYYGRFDKLVGDALASAGSPPPVVMISQGTSGDQHWMDYSQAAKKVSVDSYSREMADIALASYRRIAFRGDISLAMAERRLGLARRVADARRLAWAETVLAGMGDRLPQSVPEVYAREQTLLAAEPQRELILQAIRVGDLGITALPCEVYALSGLKLKAQSPLPITCNMELANGCEGYIPPPEQHALGGYTTWAARTAALEVSAEPKLVDATLGLLEEVAGKPRRSRADGDCAYASAVLASRPFSYWRLNEWDGVRAADGSGQKRDGLLEGPFAWYLDGPSFAKDSAAPINRAVHLVGGRIRGVGAGLGKSYSVELWFCNLLPGDVRPVTAYLFARGGDEVMRTAGGEGLALGGTSGDAGRLVFCAGDEPAGRVAGRTPIERGQWQHVVLVRNGDMVSIYLNGGNKAEIEARTPARFAAGRSAVFAGGRNDNVANLEGKIDEVAVYDRALSTEEIARHFAAGRKTSSE